MMEEEKEANEMERSWADLPPQIYSLILEKLPEISEFVRSRTVCKAWRFSSSVSNMTPQFPWIIKLSDGPDLELYSITFNKVYTIRALCSSGKRLFGTAGGYLLTGQIGKADKFSLLNPLNNREVPLPVLRDCDRGFCPYSYSYYNSSSFRIDDYLFMTEQQRSVRCKPGDVKWEIIGPGHGYQYRCYYLKGLLFIVDGHTGVTKIMDISSLKELYVIPPPKYEKTSNMFIGGPYFVESYEEILVVRYNYKRNIDYKFYIHRLEFGNGKENPCWVRLSSIGDRILFFEFPNPTGRGFCLRASDFTRFKENCIYFIDLNQEICLGHVHVINMYDIENGEIVFINTPFDRKSHISWFIPTLNHI